METREEKPKIKERKEKQKDRKKGTSKKIKNEKTSKDSTISTSTQRDQKLDELIEETRLKGAEEDSKKEEKEIYKNDKEAFKVVIHYMDWTEGLPFILTHPVVEVCLFDGVKGELLSKSCKERKVTSFYEDPKISKILPLMTKPFDMMKMRSLFCNWEEELLFNESPKYIENSENKVIALFHLKDFVSSSNSVIKENRTQLGMKFVGWRTFAWAFLNIVGCSGQPYTNKKVRLQLFMPKKIRNVKFTDIYVWWKSGHRKKYQSSLHVTLEKTLLKVHPESALRSQQPNQREGGTNQSHDSISTERSKGRDSSDTNVTPKPHYEPVKWLRDKSQPFQIPNNIALTLSSLDGGCMVVKFSNDGTKLACGTLKFVLIYDVIEGGSLLQVLRGHSGIIYDLSWSQNDRELVSCSADATVRIWNVVNEHEQEIIAHPSFVYCAKLCPNDNSVLVSGCFDHILRVWVRKSSGFILHDEFNVHLGYITSLCFSKDASSLFSADSHGILVAWRMTSTKMKHRSDPSILTYVDEYKIKSVYGNIINHISCHPSGYRLLVHTRNSQIRLINQELWVTTQILDGILNQREMVKSCFSPCGSFVLSGSEDGSVFVWDSENGTLLSSIFDLPFQKATSCVDFHPFDHMISICSHEPGAPVVIMSYDPNKLSVNNVPLTVLPVQEYKTSKSNEDLTKKQKSSVVEKAEFCDSSGSQILPENQLNRFNEQSSPFGRDLKDVGKELLSKLDFILKVSADDTKQLIAKKKENLSNRKATALYSFKTTSNDELPLKTGEVVEMIEKCNSDWWLVKNSMGKEGLVPSSYLSLGDERKFDKLKGHQMTNPNVSERQASSNGSLEISTEDKASVHSARARRRKMLEKIRDI